MTNRSDRRESKPNHPLTTSGRADDWLLTCGFHHGRELRAPIHRSKIRMQSDFHQFTKIITFVVRDRERDRELHRRGDADVCLLLTEESRYGVVDQAPKKIRSAERALTYLPPRRSRSKPIARVCPSCPGGEICSARLFSRSRELSVPQTPIRPDVAFLRVNPNCR